MRKRELSALGIIAAIGLLAVATPRTYVLTPNGSWPRGDTVTMYLQLGTGRVTLLDGATSWNDVAATAVSMWDRQLGSIDFVSRIENRSRRSGDGVNDVFWADDVYGDAFGDGLAAAVTWHRGDHRVEADVLFNRAKSWNSYRGPWRSGLADFRRMALYEFGWVLGLGHPDKAGQSVPAIMNWSGDGSEDLQDDDIRGIRALYGEPPAPPGLSMPPRADTIDFRHAMETEYRNRGAVGRTTFVHINAGATWLAEYVWYRVSLCDHATAVARVFAQLEGRGVQPVCGTPAVVEKLPEPEEIVTFREELETEFRDFLKGPPNDYLMPQNEEAYLVREYLLQRFSGFDHRQATDRLRPPFRVPTPTPRPNPTPAPSPAPAPAPQPAPAPSPGPPPPAGGRFDGIYDFSVTHGAPGGGLQTRSFPRWFIVRNGRITNSEGNVTGSVLDNFGNVSFNGPCWANQSGATFTGILNAGSGPKFGQGNSVCTSGGHTASWRAFNGS